MFSALSKLMSAIIGLSVAITVGHVVGYYLGYRGLPASFLFGVFIGVAIAIVCNEIEEM